MSKLECKICAAETGVTPAKLTCFQIVNDGHLRASLKAALFLILLSGAPCPVLAQGTPPVPRGQTAKTAPPRQAIPDPVRMNILIRDAIIALNHANRTGNYTVLRDLGTPAFQQLNDSARLGMAFAGLRAKDSDFSPVFFINPVLVQQPSLDSQGVLRLLGYFPTQPQRIVFDVSFQQAGGRWRLTGLIADIQPAPAATAAASNPAPPASARKPEDAKRPPAQAATAPEKPATHKAEEPAKSPGKLAGDKHANTAPPPPSQSGGGKGWNTVTFSLSGD